MLRVSTLNRITPPCTFFRQTRHAEVVNTPASILFGGHANNWDRINRIANEASRVKVDYDSKYAFKLKLAAEKRGLASVDELKQSVLSKRTVKPQQTLQKPTAKQPSVHHTSAALKKPTRIKYESTAPTLYKIVKLDLLAKESKESIAKIWTHYYANKGGITTVIPTDTYSEMYQTSQKYPLFILPMPRDTSLEFFFLQFQSHQCNITSLLEYKTKGEKARPFLTITYFPELADTKGIVLMRGEINDKPTRMLSTANAQFLAFAVQYFYSSATGSNSRKLVEMFNTLPEEFDYHDLIEEMENMMIVQ